MVYSLKDQIGDSVTAMSDTKDKNCLSKKCPDNNMDEPAIPGNIVPFPVDSLIITNRQSHIFLAPSNPFPAEMISM